MIMPARRTSTISAIVLLLGTSPVIAQEIVAETPKTQTAIDPTPIVEAPITNGDRAHWAFRPIQRPTVPQIQNSEFRIQNVIDAFIAVKLAKNGLALAPAADKAML